MVVFGSICAGAIPGWRLSPRSCAQATLLKQQLMRLMQLMRTCCCMSCRAPRESVACIRNKLLVTCYGVRERVASARTFQVWLSRQHAECTWRGEPCSPAEHTPSFSSCLSRCAGLLPHRRKKNRELMEALTGPDSPRSPRSRHVPSGSLGSRDSLFSDEGPAPPRPGRCTRSAGARGCGAVAQVGVRVQPGQPVFQRSARLCVCSASFGGERQARMGSSLNFQRC